MKPLFITVPAFVLGGYDGITLYPFIFMTKTARTNKAIVKHELIHVDQIRREGWFKFYIKYIYFNIKFGYRNNPYEIEAYSRQHE